MKRGLSYKAKSNRLEWYDYSQNGAYFVTICVKDKQHIFGEVKNQEMVLNEYWETVESLWKEIRNQFDFIELDQFVVMPNHIHWIVVIAGNNVRQDAMNRISTNDSGTGWATWIFNPMLQKNLWRIMRWYKWKCSYELRKISDDFFSWQPNYNDHIIRNEHELQRIRQYIYDNPWNWDKDEENT